MIYFHFALAGKQIDNTPAYAYAKGKLATDPKVVCNDVDQSLDVKYPYGILVGSPVAEVLRGAQIVINPMAKDAFITEFATLDYKRDLANVAALDRARESLRTVQSQDVPDPAATLKQRFDTRNKTLVQDLDKYLKRVPTPGDAEELKAAHEQARKDAASTDWKLLTAALQALDFIEKRMNGEVVALAEPKAKDITGALVESAGGACLGRPHQGKNSFNVMVEAIKSGKIEMLFLEELVAEDQDQIDAYLQGPDEDLPPALKSYVDQLSKNHGVDWEGALKEAKKRNIKIFAIDSGVAREEGHNQNSAAFGEQRCAQMNQVIKEVMEKALRDNPGKKFLAVVGAEHSNTHKGGIPGVSQMFGIPSVRVNDEGGDPDEVTWDRENTALRGMPSRDEQMHVDALIRAAEKGNKLLPPMEQILKEADALCEEERRKGNQLDVTTLKFRIMDKVKRRYKEQFRDKATRQAAALKEAGALPSFEETVFIEAYAKKATATTGKPTEPDRLEQAAVRKLELMKNELRTRFDTENKKLVQSLASYVRQQPKPGDADQLVAAHNAARDAVGRGTLGDLQNALDELAQIRAAVENKPAPPRLTTDVDALLKHLGKDNFEADLESVNQGRKAFGDVADAIKANDTATVDRLLSADPDLIKVKSRNGQTLLHIAAAEENVDLMKLILARCPGAKKVLNLPDADGNQPLHLACKTRRYDADTDTPVDAAKAMARQNDAVQWLLAEGADVDAQNMQGATALHLTSLSYNTEALKTLFASGADTSLRDDRGWTALETSVAGTSLAIEQEYYAQGKAAPTPVGDTTQPQSTVDILCKATICENPADALTVRRSLEQLYANPETRPVLDLLALDMGSGRNPPNVGTRICVASGKLAKNLIQVKKGSPEPNLYTGGYDKKTGVIHICADTEHKDFAGVLIHEMTHRATHVVSDSEELLPFASDGQKVNSQQAYIAAIEADVKNMHLMSKDASPLEQKVYDIIMKDMGGYANAPGDDGGDAALMQEFIVRIPQLIAEYGKEPIAKLAPRLYAQYQAFQNACNTKRADPRFDASRGMVDNTNVAFAERQYKGRDFKDGWVQPDSAALLQAAREKMEIQYATRFGEEDPSKKRASSQVGTVKIQPVTIKYSSDCYRIPPAQADAVKKKLDKAQKALAESLKAGLLTLPVSTEDMRTLIAEVTDLAANAPEKDLEKLVQAKADAWLMKSKIHYIDYKAGTGEPMTDVEMAETVALSSEYQAYSGTDIKVDREQHQKLVAKLSKSLGDFPAEKKATLTAQKDIMDRITAQVSGGKSKGIYVKTGRTIVGTRDRTKVTIDISNARKQWVKVLGQLAA